MWSPTHIQVTVQRAKDLLTKGKNGTNNCFVTIALGKEKYQTSVKEKAEANVSWNEECELKIPDQGNRAELILTCLHRNNLGIDEFLGQATLPLNEMDVYDRPRSKFFKLQSKPGKEKKNKERGELEVRISFVVKSGSLTDLSKKEKHKSSVGQLASSVGGSLLSLGAIEKRKGIKKFAKSLGSKMHLHSKKKNKEGDDLSFTGSFASIDQANAGGGLSRYGQRAGEADPGVISEDEDEFVFDNLSHKSSGSSLNVRNSSGGGLQVPPLKNHAPRVPSPLLDQQATAAYKGNDIEEESESEKFEENFNIQRTPSYNKEQTNKIEEEQNKLPPPSQQEKHSPISNDWDLKPYTTQKFESSNNKRLSFSALSEVKLEEEPREEEKAKTLAPEPPKEQLKPASSFSKLEAAVVPEISELVAEVPKLRSEENSKKKLKNDEWESKLYLDINKSDSLKRNTWQTARVQLPITDLESPKTESQRFSLLFENDKKGEEKKNDAEESDSESSTSTDDDDDQEEDPDVVAAFVQSKNENNEVVKKIANNINDQFIANETAKVEEEQMPKPSPRYYPKLAEAAKLEETTIKLNPAYEAKKLEQANMLDNIKLNLGYERQAANKENNDGNEGENELQNAKLRERNEEDRRILNFINDSKMRESLDRKSNGNGDLNSSPKEREQREKRFGKLKNLNEGGKQASPRFNERIIIGHEKSHAERRSEMTEALAKKYDGKSREELMLIANGMENEVLIYRQRVKELEDYLDNLLLRVMETHPKILQNPYSRTKSTKSG